MTDPAGVEIGAALVAGPALVDSGYAAPTMATAAAASFGGLVALEGYTLEGEAVPGESLAVTLRWRVLAPAAAEWTLTVQLGAAGADGPPLAQADAPPASYPATAWVPGTVFTETRTLELPADAPPQATYVLRVGWYRVEGAATDAPVFVRLPLEDEDSSATGDLFTVTTVPAAP